MVEENLPTNQSSDDIDLIMDLEEASTICNNNFISGINEASTSSENVIKDSDLEDWEIEELH